MRAHEAERAEQIGSISAALLMQSEERCVLDELYAREAHVEAQLRALDAVCAPERVPLPARRMVRLTLLSTGWRRLQALSARRFRGAELDAR